MRLYVIVVHHGAQEGTRRAIDALFAGVDVPDGVVVVNNSTEDFADVQDAVVVVQPQHNYGYGGGVNVGLGRAYAAYKPRDEDLIVAMNNDVIVERNSLRRLKEWKEGNPEPSLLGVKTREPNGIVAGGGVVNKLTGRAELVYASPTTKRGRGVEALDYIHGAFMAASWSVWRAVQGVPEDHFLYWEDVALSHKVRQLGFPLRVVDTVTVGHDTAAQDEIAPQQLYYLIRNGAHFMANEATGFTKHFWRPYNYARLGWHTVRQSDPVVREALRDAISGKRGKRS